MSVGTGDRELREWRRRALVAAGFDAPLAEAVARQPGFDVHALLELVDRGCPPRLAVAILAPLDEEPGHDDRRVDER